MDALTRRQFDRSMFAKDRTLAIRVGDYASRDIKEASFEYGYIKGDTYKPGGTCAGSGKITFTSIITTFNKLDILHPEIGLLVGNTYQWVKMGEYFINDIEIDRNRNTTTLELMDGMFKLNREYVTDLHFPAEVREVIQEICLKTGIELANDYFGISAMRYHIEQVPEGKKLSFRDMLSAMTQMIGMSCFFNREGKMEIRDLNESNITINADSYFLHGLTKSEIEYQIAGITCKTDKKSLTVGMKTGRSLELDNVFMTQSALNDLYYKLKNLTYYPYNLNYQGHLLLEVGQWVTIQTNKKETFKVPVLSQSFTFKGGLRGRISADSKAGNDTQYSYEGTITKRIKQQDGIEAKIQAQIEAADAAFDAEFKKRKKEIDDGIEQYKAKTEEVKQDISNEIDKRFQNFDNASIQEARRKAEEALKNAGASSLLAQEAKQIGLDSVARLEAFKSQTTSAQTALSSDFDALKQTVNNEVNQTSEFRRTTTEALSRMTGQMDGFATKSEVKQGIDGLTQTFAKMRVGGRNLLRGSKGPFMPDRKPANFDNAILYVGNTSIYMEQGQEYIISAKTDGNFTALHDGNKESDDVVLWIMDKDVRNYQIVSDLKTGTTGTKIIWNKPTGIYHLRVNTYHKEAVKSVWDVKVEKGNIATDWSPAIEDVESQITEARTEFKQAADGLSTKMAAVETYVGQDNQRQESLRRYTRDESARQVNAVREQISREYVGKSTYQEDVRGIERKFEAITNSKNGSIATQIANYKNSVDGRLTEITSMISGKANQTDFQRVKETSQLYERIIGNTENGIANNVARMAMTSQLFQVEVAKNASNGQNLLKGTKSFSGDWKNMAAGWKKHSDKYQGCDVLFKNNSRNGIGQEIDANIGEIYTFSLWMKSDWKNDTVNFYVNRNGSVEKGWGVPSETSVAITNEWKRYSFTFKITANGFIFPRVERLNQNTNLYVAGLKLEKGSYATPYTEAPEDTDEAIRSVQTQLAGSWAVQNLTSAGSIVSQINATNNQILVEAEKIRFKGKTLADQLTAIDGYFKRLFVGEGNFATLNTEVLKSNSITADKLVMDMAMARLFVSSDIFTNTLASKTAFINKLQSVIVSSTLLEGYKGWIGGFQIGTHDSGSGRWLTGRNHFSVGMGDGEGGSGQTALWVNWGGNWSAPGYYAWFVKNNGKMYCYNTAEFWNTPIVNGDLKVTGNIIYDGGAWIYSNEYVKIGRSSTYYFYLEKANRGRDYFLVSNDTSDRRLKSNIQESSVSGIDVINRLKTYSYRKEFNNEVEDISCGIMAQDVQKYAPDAFREAPDGVYTYNTFALVPYLIKAIQELNQKIEKMEKTIA
nr:MAG TPA: Neck appendage protein [Caudoviricetes sp.]